MDAPRRSEVDKGLRLGETGETGSVGEKRALVSVRVVSSLTPTGMAWANMLLKMGSAFTPDKMPYHG
jgi:hypothetical protein